MRVPTPSRVQLIKRFWSARRDGRPGDVALYKSALFRVRAHDHIEAQLDRLRHRVPQIEPSQLAELQAGTLGSEYLRFLRDNTLTPITPSPDVPRQLIHEHTFAVRYAMLHDLFHVLLGFDASWPGEAGVWGFVLGQDLAPAFNAAGRAALAYAPLAAPGSFGKSRAQWKLGRRIGRALPPLIALPLEDQLGEPLEELRARLGILETGPGAIPNDGSSSI